MSPDASHTSSIRHSAFTPAPPTAGSSAVLDLGLQRFSAVSLSSILFFILYKHGLNYFSVGQNIREFLT